MAGERAKENLTSAQVKMKQLYNRRMGKSQFSPGDQVLALLLLVMSPFQAKFHGLYVVLRQVSELNYLLGGHLNNSESLGKLEFFCFLFFLAEGHQHLGFLVTLTHLGPVCH